MLPRSWPPTDPKTAMRDEDVIRCWLYDVTLALIEQNEEWAVERAKCMTLEISRSMADDVMVSLAVAAS